MTPLHRGILTLPLPMVLIASVLAASGCSQAPAPETGAPPGAEAAPPEAEATETTGAGTEPAAAEPEPDSTVIVIERRQGEREREAEPRTLYEAAIAARKERAEAEPSRISVTDDNLHEFQGESLTFAVERAEAEAGDDPEEAADPAPVASSEEARGEAYWRSRMGGVRLALRQAVDDLAELQNRAASLRRSFYAQDDPYVRDAEIKPAWDRALDRIAQTRETIFRLREELDAALEEGRRAGALPGWLREGIALEPRPDELPEPREDGTHEPGEPRVMEIGEEPPGG